MAIEHVVQLFRAAQADPSLKQALNSAPSPEAFVQRARALGYEFTVEEWQEATRFTVEELESQLSEIPGL
jgi:predicted ribosomally synthesized peptide with nif11-like leader